MSLKTLVLSAGLVLGAMSASAATILTDCGTIGDAEASTCDGASVNLAVDSTQFAFEALVADDASSGSLSIDTFVDPFYSTGMASANVLLSFFAPVGTYEAASVTLSFGGTPVDLVLSGGSFTTMVDVTAMFSSVGEIIPLTLTWTGLAGGERISIGVAAVPLPAGLLLLGTALGGLGLTRRRRKMAA